MAYVVNQDELRAIHRALLDGEPTAPLRLCDACQTPLCRLLKGSNPSAGEDDLLDSVVDALLFVIKNPREYDPTRGSLSNFLHNVSSRRLVDRIRKNYSQIRLTAALVELQLLGANNASEEQHWRQIVHAGRDQGRTCDRNQCSDENCGTGRPSL